MRARLTAGPPLLLDGGMGSLLISSGLEVGVPPEAWLLHHPERVLQAHREYVQAGSEAVHTCTFGGQRLRLRPFGLEDELRRIHEVAVDLARRSGSRWVLGDVGPAGRGESWRPSLREQLEVLADLGVDGLHLETLVDAREALHALAVAQEVAPHLPVLVSCTFGLREGAFSTPTGDPVAPTIRALVEGGASAVGASCSVTSSQMGALGREVLAVAGEVPVVLQPSAGLPRRAASGFVYDQDPADFARDMASLARAGVRVLGGCCGTDPRFIEGLCRSLDVEQEYDPEAP